MLAYFVNRAVHAVAFAALRLRGKRVAWALVALVLGGCAHAVKPAAAPVAPAPPGPRLSLRASPRIGIPPLRVLLTAEIAGEPDERFYCPTVVWLFPNDTAASETSDCAPYAQRDDYQRRWVRPVVIGAPGQWPFVVEIRKAGQVVARATVSVYVAGDVGTFTVDRGQAVSVAEAR